MSRNRQSCGAQQRGFALIEALIAVVVLATGLLALTALQGALIRSSADAKARSQLAVFAESRLDASRISNAASLTPGTGQKLATNQQLADVAAAMGASSVTEATTVTQYVANGGTFTGYTTLATANAALAAAGSGAAQFKRIDTVLSWTDATGSNARRLMASTSISPLALNASNVLVDRPPPSGTAYIPIVRRPVPSPDSMIPIALANGDETAATNPKPDISFSTTSHIADTRFEVLTFNKADNLGDVSLVRFDKRVENAFVGCQCKAGTTGFGSGGLDTFLKGRAFRPSYWDGTSYTEPDAAGVAVRGPDPAAPQSDLCDMCCRDHRDPSGAAHKFNPWITTHLHYLPPSTTPVDDQSGSGTFLEACRVVRVNGLWRATPDPRVEDLALLGTSRYPSTLGGTVAPANNNRATQPAVAASVKASTGTYLTYIYEFLKEKFYSKSTVDRLALQASSGLNAPNYVPIGLTDTNGYNDVAGTTDTDVRWLHARGLLVDSLEPSAVTKIDNAITSCTGTTSKAQTQCILPYLPIVVVNISELAAWAGKQLTETGIDTSAFAGLTVNFGQALTNRFASALARVDPIGPNDGDNPLKDEQTFTLIPGVTRTGKWLTVTNQSGTAFGDPALPKRGAATVSPPVDFTATLVGFTCTGATSCIDKPRIAVGTSGSNSCDAPNYSNCHADSTTLVKLAMDRYNRQIPVTTGSRTLLCTVLVRPDKCETHAFRSVLLDGVTVPATFTVTAGSNTKDDMGILLFSPTLTLRDTTSTPAGPSIVRITFIETTVNAKEQCNQPSGIGVASWTCPQP